MFLGIDPFYCNVYRLTGYINHDFSTSEEGEVDEIWTVVVTDVPCRYDMGNAATRRRKDGMVDTGRRRFYVEADIDIRAGDRIEVHGGYYLVEESDPIYDARAEIHHHEGVMTIIDWTYIS